MLLRHNDKICALLFITSVMLTIKMTESLSMKELSKYPNFVAFLYIHLLAPGLISFVTVISLFKDKTLRETVTKEALRKIKLVFYKAFD